MFATLEAFLNGESRNAWLKVGSLDVYMRKSAHNINGTILPVLDVANILQTSRKRHRIHYSDLSAKLVEMLKDRSEHGIYVENVLNPKFAQRLLTLGYKILPVRSWGCPSFFLPKD